MEHILKIEIELTAMDSCGNVSKRILYRGQDCKILEAVEDAIDKSLGRCMKRQK